MKISELIQLLEKAKEEYGDVETVIYKHHSDTIEAVSGTIELSPYNEGDHVIIKIY